MELSMSSKTTFDRDITIKSKIEYIRVRAILERKGFTKIHNATGHIMLRHELFNNRLVTLFRRF